MREKLSKAREIKRRLEYLIEVLETGRINETETTELKYLISVIAMAWWRHDLTEAERLEFCNNYYSRDHHTNLTGREIEAIWKRES